MYRAIVQKLKYESLTSFIKRFSQNKKSHKISRVKI